MNPVYLGDSVYAEFDGYQIILTTRNGLGGPSNTIALEPSVLECLDMYRERLRETAHDRNNSPAG